MGFLSDGARRTGPDRLLVPMMVEAPSRVPGGVITGHGYAEIGPDHPDYERWAKRIDGRAG
ncbi:hypothetical protein [Actinoplanes rectilineatus]|uniref:hypothetical protein n=1 Tax=Actinoplanes rectilineatus TaxID=113571 RepID=UPI0012F7B531|nr:hypothetical protein [Actinoplanes rectilineatus]